MSEYWKAIPKKFCEVCKCWFTDKGTGEFHEKGLRHQNAVKKRLTELSKRNQVQKHEADKLNGERMKIDSATMSAFSKDKAADPNKVQGLTYTKSISNTNKSQRDKPSTSLGSNRFGVMSSLTQPEESKTLISVREKCSNTMTSKTAKQKPQHLDNNPLNEAGEKSDNETGDSELEPFNDLKRKMIQTYLELKEEENEDEETNTNGSPLERRLIERLVTKFSLNYLILNLYPNNEGYSIGMKNCFNNSEKNNLYNNINSSNGISPKSGDNNKKTTNNNIFNNNKKDVNHSAHDKNSADHNRTKCKEPIESEKNVDPTSEPEFIETIRLPYEEEDLLDFIDNGELPPMLVDIFDDFNENNDHQLFYCGSIFMEVRDYRKTTSSSTANDQNKNYESCFVRLRPTNQTLLNDIARLTSSLSHLKKWTQEEKTTLEAKIILETAEPLCLDPNPVVAIVSNKLDYEKRWFKASKKIERSTKKNSQVYRNKIKKFESLPAPRGLELFDFLQNRKDRTPITTRLNKKINNVNVMNNNCTIEPIDPKLVEIEKFAKKLEPVNLKCDNSLIRSDEYIMEFLSNEGRSSVTCVVIYHRPIDDCYFGKLFLDKRKDNSNRTGNSSTFHLGHKDMVDKYIDQFKEILTENGRKPVKITHKSTNQPPKVTYTNSAIQINGPTLNDTEDSEGRENVSKKPKIIQTNQKNAVSVLRNQPRKLSSSLLSSNLSTATTTTPTSTPSTLTPSTSSSLTPSPNQITNSIPSTSTCSSLTIPINEFTSPNQSAIQVDSNCISNHRNLDQDDGKSQSETLVVAPSLPLGTYTITGTNPGTNTNLPQGINLASLNLAQCSNLRLHNLVSFPNIQGVSQQQIAVPISLTMMQGSGSSQAQTAMTAAVTNNNIVNLQQHQKINQQINHQMNHQINNQPQQLHTIHPQVQHSQQQLQPHPQTQAYIHPQQTLSHLHQQQQQQQQLLPQPPQSQPQLQQQLHPHQRAFLIDYDSRKQV
ncbi:transcription factor SPT20 homolog isoform X2 [Panonychus citri]|uniref:transcription factor SPT20 homolog isoform X2 n=1 Tax=Panonychus citri TaxID=50023 RepID=UPI0023070BFE|nr:transcription factor SPT20 homolog isoform X2 [Panonychus citri]